MIVQIYETQQASEARALEAVGVDHILTCRHFCGSLTRNVLRPGEFMLTRV
jgi:hypothetical protein